ncbi:hypothetical protein D3C81_877780 [compost metagenome]
MEFLQEVLGQQRDVLLPRAQWRDLHREHVEAVEQVGAEAPGLHRLGQVLVGGGDHPHVDLARAVAADPLQLAFLQHAQQGGLGARGQLDDFVEEDGAAVGALEAPGARLGGAGVGALLHPEQLRLDQVRRDRRTVHRDERLLGPRAAQVHAARDHFLAHPGLAEQQYRDLAVRGLVDGLADALVGRRLADAVVLAVLGLQAAAQGGDLRLQLVELLDHRIALEVGLELVGVVPLLGGLADHPALVVATAAAADFLVDDLAAHEGRGVAAGVAEQGPARRLVHQAQLGLADFHLEGVEPLHLGVEAAVLDVDVHLDRPRAQHALEHVQLRSGEEDVQFAAAGAQLARQLGVLEAGLVAQAQEEALGALDAEQVDHLAAEVGQCRERHQQHALLAQPDLAFLADEADLVAQVLNVRVLQLRLVLDGHQANPLVVVVSGGCRLPRRRRARGSGEQVGAAGEKPDSQHRRLHGSRFPEKIQPNDQKNRQLRFWSIAQNPSGLTIC